MKDRNLEEVRRDIDGIDGELLSLFLRRMACAREVAQIKRAEGGEVFHPYREQDILARVGAQAGQDARGAQALFSVLMDISRAAQWEILGGGAPLRSLLLAARAAPDEADRTHVACQGLPGSYSDEAAVKLFGAAPQVFYKEFSDVFDAVENGVCYVGVVPVENSSAGSVHEVYDLLLSRGFYITGAAEVPICHCLCGVADARREDVKTVYSHPQALAQCSQLVKREGYDPQPYSNTAAAAQMVGESGKKSIAALCSRQAAETYGLHVLMENVQNAQDNRTRFLAVSKELFIEDAADRISVCFSLPHKTGSLYRILQRFALKGLNLTRIESRPLPDRPFEYAFALDFTGNAREEGALALLCVLSEELPSFAFLGNYTER